MKSSIFKAVTLSSTLCFFLFSCQTQTESNISQPESISETESSVKVSSTNENSDEYTIETGHYERPFIRSEKDKLDFLLNGDGTCQAYRYDLTHVNHYVVPSHAPNGDIVTSIFFDGSYLEWIDLPSTIREIPANCFNCCRHLKAIVIPEGVREIGENAFRYCTSLTYISLPSTVKSIQQYAFEDCFSLTNLDFPENLEYLGRCAFYESGLQKVVLPSGLLSTDRNVFSNCYSLTSIHFPGSLKVVNDICFFCNSLSEIILDDGIQALAQDSIYSPMLTSIFIPASVTTLGYRALNGEMDIYFEVSSMPENWTDGWSDSISNIYWGYTREEYNQAIKAKSQS